MKRRISDKICLILLLLCTIFLFASCGKAENASDRSYLNIGGTKYSAVKVFSDLEDLSYAEKIVDAFRSATSLPAELSESREEANVVVTADTSEIDIGEDEWVISAKLGVHTTLL